MGLELERGAELFFQKNWIKLSFILFPRFLQCSFASDTQKNICNPSVCRSNDSKNCSICLRTEESNGKYSVMGGSTLTALWMKNLFIDNQLDYGEQTVCQRREWGLTTLSVRYRPTLMLQGTFTLLLRCVSLNTTGQNNRTYHNIQSGFHSALGDPWLQLIHSF
jgi:hypothetical protein